MLSELALSTDEGKHERLPYSRSCQKGVQNRQMRKSFWIHAESKKNYVIVQIGERVC